LNSNPTEEPFIMSTSSSLTLDEQADQLVVYLYENPRLWQSAEWEDCHHDWKLRFKAISTRPGMIQCTAVRQTKKRYVRNCPDLAVPAGTDAGMFADAMNWLVDYSFKASDELLKQSV
jgi:hypothetical protein